MAQLTFQHSIYDTFDHQGGEKPAVSDRQLDSLLKRVDNALDRSPGFFFATIDGRFIFGFEVQRTDEQSRHQSMAFFDLYSTSVDDLSDVDLRDLHDFLSRQRITDYGRDIRPTVSYRVSTTDSDGEWESTQSPDQDSANHAKSSRETANQTEAEPRSDSPFVSKTPADDEADRERSQPKVEENAPGADFAGKFIDSNTQDTQDQSDSPATSPDRSREQRQQLSDSEPDYQLIARLWEGFRSESTPVHATLDQVDAFTNAVDGSLRQISFVSEERADARHFHVVGNPPAQQAQQARHDALAESIRNIAAEQPLRWSALPTYDEELREEVERQRAQLSEEINYETVLQKAFVEAFESVKPEVKDHETNAGKLFTEAATGNLSATDAGQSGKGKMVSKLGGMLSGGDRDADVDQILRRAQTNATDEETRRVLAKRLVEEAAPTAAEQIAQEIVTDLERELVEIIETQSEQVAVKTLEKVDEVKRSKPYRQVHGPK